MKNLLICGMPGCGKSTVILNELKKNELLPECGGFRTARILSQEGVLRGFSQFYASEDRETVLITDDDVPNMFLNFRRNPPLVPEVFCDFTVKSLEDPDKRIIVLDEMGGNELLIPSVYKAFIGILKDSRPCIGVLKSPKHAADFSPEAYFNFRTEIENETDTEITEMSKDKREETKKHIENWLLENNRI